MEKTFDVLEQHLRPRACRCTSCAKKIPAFMGVMVDEAGSYYHSDCADKIRRENENDQTGR